MTIDTLDVFKKELLKTKNKDEIRHFVQKHFFHGVPFIFKDREDNYFDFRKKIAEHFSIAFHDVFIVGSAKLGFSYVKRTIFSLNSDIDVVLVNEELFEKFYKKICDYQYLAQYNGITDLREKAMYNEFLEYLVKGWMRPDKLPISFQVGMLKNEWFEFFKSISYGKSEVGNYDVKAGLYKSYYYLEKYYIEGIERYLKEWMIKKETK